MCTLCSDLAHLCCRNIHGVSWFDPLLLQEYVRKLGACLVDMTTDSASELSMHRWAGEATSLMVCIALRNPWAIKAFNAAVDSSTAAEGGGQGSSPQQAHSEELLVSPHCCQLTRTAVGQRYM